MPWGCNSSSSGGGGSTGPQTEAFEVVETTPVDEAVDVGEDTPVEVVFSDEVDFATVDAVSFEVVDSQDVAVPGDYSEEPGEKKVVFTPRDPYAWEETVTVRLSEALHSTSGEPLEPFSFSFTVRAEGVEPPPTIPLRIDGLTPAPNARNVPPDQEVTLIWSEALDPDTVTLDSVWLSSGFTGRLPTLIDPLQDEGKVLELRAGRPLVAAERVTVHLASTIRSADGKAFEGLTFRFKVRSDPPASERTREKVFSTLGQVSRIVAGDLNSDGVTDLVHATEGETFVDVLLGDTDGELGLAVRVEVQRQVLALTLGDADADGDLDLLVGAIDSARLFWSRFLEDGADPAQIRFEPGPSAATGSAVRSAAIADVDREGAPDVLLDTDRGIEVRLGGLESPPAETIGSQRQSRTDLLVEDLDLDGFQDLVFGDVGGQGVAVCFFGPPPDGEDPPALFAEPEVIELASPVQSLALANLGGDALPEVIALTESDPGAQAPYFRIIAATEGGFTEVGGGPAVPVQDPPAVPPPSVGGFAVEDLDGNGVPDLIVAATDSNAVLWFPGMDGTFDFAAVDNTLLVLPEPTFVAAGPLSTPEALDLLASGGNEIHVLLPEGDEPPPVEDTFEMAVDDLQVRQKDTGATAIVRLTNTKPLQGYTVALGFDPAAISPREVSLEGSATGSADPEFTDYRVLESGEALVYSVILDVTEPFGDKLLPDGEDQVLFRLVFDVPETAPLGVTSLTFTEDPGPPPISTALVVESQNVSPETTDGEVEILPPVEPPPPTNPNRLELTSAAAEPDSDVSLTVLGSTTEPLDAFTVVVTFPADVLEVQGFDLTGTVTEEQAPELVVPNLNNDEGFAIVTVILDFVPPFDRQKIPAGEEMDLCVVSFRVAPDAADGTYPVVLENDQGDPPLDNIFVVGGLTVLPGLYSGEITIGAPAGTEFLRGDVDENGEVDISDALALVNYLFTGQATATCLDALDSDDSGSVDLTDSIYLLNYLFKGGTPPPPPFPEPGVDPTADSMEC